MDRSVVESAVLSLVKEIKKGVIAEEGTRDGVSWVIADHLIDFTVEGKTFSSIVNKIKHKKVSAKGITDALEALCANQTVSLDEEAVEFHPEEESHAEIIADTLPENSVIEIPLSSPPPPEDFLGDVTVPKQVRVYTRKPGPKGKRSEGSDFDIAKSILETELSGFRLVTREALQIACDKKVGGKFSLQLTSWIHPHTYKNGSVRPALLTPSGLGKKSGVFINPFYVENKVEVQSHERVLESV